MSRRKNTRERTLEAAVDYLKQHHHRWVPIGEIVKAISNRRRQTTTNSLGQMLKPFVSNGTMEKKRPRAPSYPVCYRILIVE